MAGRPETETAVVIGGGIIGIACAHYLDEAGYDVTVIERATVAGACSHGNCGYICPSHILPLTTPDALRSGFLSLFDPSAPFRVKPRLDIRFLRWMWEFARRCSERRMIDSARHLMTILESSADAYRRLLNGGRIPCKWQQDGLLYVLRSEAGAHDFARTDALLGERFGVSARWIEGRDLPGFDPSLKPGLAGAYLYPGDASLRPDRLNAAWVGRLRESGVTFVENCSFESVERVGRRALRIQASGTSLSADLFILATGALSGKLARHFGGALPIEPGKGYSITMDRPAPSPGLPMLFPEHHVGITPFDDGFRIGSMMEFAGFDETIPEARLAQLRAAVAPYLNVRLPVANTEEWFGWRPMTWDSLPIIGQAPGFDNVYLATGHNMLGMTLAPATGKLIAELATGSVPHIDPEPFSPARF